MSLTGGADGIYLSVDIIGQAKGAALVGRISVYGRQFGGAAGKLHLGVVVEAAATA
jgi:hypothetical protein